MKRAFAGVLALLAGTSFPVAARADEPPSPTDAMAAEAMFAEARSLMQQGNYGQACPKLEGSLRLDRAVGTMLNLAECYERTQRPASAWYWFREGAALASREGQRERANYARDRAKELEPTLCRLTIRPAQERVPADIVVRRDGVLVERDAWGVPVPVDPGPHTITAAGTGGRDAFQKDITVSRGEQSGQSGQGEQGCAPIIVALPVFAPAPVDVRPPPTVTAKPDRGPAGGDAPPTSRPASSGWATPHTLAVAAGGVGLVGVGIGTAFAINALSLKSASDRGCTALGCTSEAQRQGQDAGVSADVATVAFVAGGAFLVTGVVLWIVAPSLRSRSAASGLALSF